MPLLSLKYYYTDILKVTLMKPDLLLCLYLFIFYDALSPMRTIHICIVMGSSTGT